MNIKLLEETIGYTFSNKKIIEKALTHSSYNSDNNERLEFLGDRILGLIVAERLLEKFSSEKEGDIAKRHTAFVCKEQLAKIAKEIKLTNFFKMSQGEKKEGGENNESIMADGIEALLGAIYLDSNIDEAKKFIDKFWDFSANVTPPIDAKTALQEWAQGKGLGLPQYKLIKQSGSDHEPIFKVEVSIKDSSSTGQGKNKKEAEKDAANNYLKNNK